MTHDQVKVTREHRVTIPKNVRSKLGIKIGDKIVVKSEGNRIIIEAHKRVSNPSDVLWNLFGKAIDADATKIVEDSWKI